VAEYMELLEEEDPDRYQTQFAKFIEKEIEGDALEDLYKEVHEKIREDPEHEKTEKKDSYEQVNHQPKKTYDERKATVQAKKDAMRMALEAADDDDDDDDDEDED
jgi:large subunit ribosomal protein L5e